MICKPINSDAMHDWVSKFFFFGRNHSHRVETLKFRLDCTVQDYFISLLLLVLGLGGVKTIQV